MSAAQMLVVDRVACAGHGMCYGTSPDLIDCDDQGDPILPERRLSADQAELARAAVAACPERALSLVDASDSAST
ncbi:ferredoxin [Gordonia sp. HY442]|uniref:ferredoxin n=1 Tax=Gordonia zhenghanii TaxID=2911516 RepID=UPI001F2A7B39|nr:ferredoxin [Gordonia zhenghanii]MCF8601969.1 ferredoxin [Gordonia zhenghanii]MCF8602037.1 ferredoxin [Gordonia zhenghanii]